MQANNTAHIDANLIGIRTLNQCDTLRDTPFSINATARLARHLLADFTGLDAADRPDYATPYNIDALIAVMGAASAHLMQTAYDIVGEVDSDLPTIEQPETAPAVEVSADEMRATWQKVADLAAEQLAALNAADQGEVAPIPAVGSLNVVTLNQKAADALDKLAIDVGGLKYRNNVASSLILDRLDEMSEGEPQ